MISIDKMKRLEKALQRISYDFRAAAKNIDGFMDGISEIAEAENALAAVSKWSFVRVLSPVAKELSELTGKRYVDCLEQAREMILEEKDIPDVLWHFDMMLYYLKHGRK